VSIAPPASATIAKTLAPWKRRGSFRWIDVDAEADQWIVPDVVARDMITPGGSERVVEAVKAGE